MNNSLNNTKKKRKFNFIDFLTILTLLALVGVAVYLFSPWGNIKQLWNKDDISLSYAVEIKDVDIDYIENISENNEVIDSSSKNSLGTIVEIVKIEKAYVYDYVIDGDGNMTCVISEQPKKYNITVKITANANFKDDVGYTVNGCRIAVGETLDLRLPIYTCHGQCVRIYD